MLRKTGASSTEPSSMRKKGFDKLLKACSELDPGRQKTLSVENFEKALRKVDPNLTADQVMQMFDPTERFINHLVGHVTPSTIPEYKRMIMSYFEWYENAPNTPGKRNVNDEVRK